MNPRLQDKLTCIISLLIVLPSIPSSTSFSEKHQIQEAIRIYFRELSEDPLKGLKEEERTYPLFYKQNKRISDSGKFSEEIPGLVIQFKDLSDIDAYTWRPQYIGAFLPFKQRNTSLSGVSDEVLHILLNEVFGVPRNHEVDQDAKTSVALLLGWLLGQHGSLVGSQVFEPKNFLFLFKDTKATGMNVISILPGTYWGTSKDRVIVVGSHYDTVRNSAGFNDNGSGTAAMLKIHDNMSRNNKCKRRFSVIFVAFDLEEYGFHGSQAFVQDFLKPEILDKFNQSDIQFALILDSIMNYNTTSGSQDLYPDSATQTPEYNNFVLHNKAAGDFIALMGRDEEESDLMKEMRELLTVKSAEMKIRNLEMDSFDNFAKNFNYLRSDHIQFWRANLSAVSVSDTGNLRGIMRSCYHESCDHPSQNNTATPFANAEFLTNVIDSMTRIIRKRAC